MDIGRARPSATRLPPTLMILCRPLVTSKNSLAPLTRLRSGTERQAGPETVRIPLLNIECQHAEIFDQVATTTERPKPAPTMQRLSISKASALHLTGASMSSTSRLSMRHGSQHPVATPEPVLTRGTGVLSRTNARPNGPSAAERFVRTDPREGTLAHHTQAIRRPRACIGIGCVCSLLFRF